ncbi:MAG: hypothetical protein ACLTZT_10480 [Butyricimonas faecalis]
MAKDSVRPFRVHAEEMDVRVLERLLAMSRIRADGIDSRRS